MPSPFDRIQRTAVQADTLADSPATREVIKRQGGASAPIAVSDPAVIQKLRQDMQHLANQAVAVFGDRGSVSEWLGCVKNSISQQNAQTTAPVKSATNAALVTGLETSRQVSAATNAGVTSPAQDQAVRAPGQR